ncbi:MAG: NAD-dependent epimerase/dehydratase family protein [Terracidiphilus sp.]
MKTIGKVLVFGGTGFIGTHLAQHLLREDLSESVTLVDVNPPRQDAYAVLLQQGLKSGRVKFLSWDVRKPIPASLLADPPDLIFNLAAVHREPGHRPDEYFETNIYGARNICAYAASAGCARIVFISSIAPYGATEEPRDESSLPVPETAYGSSKLVAETIHSGWQSGGTGRTLLIVRPGVVFGPGEGGNVTRLVRSVVKGYFVYLGNRETRKAGGYVKELCFAMQFGLEYQDRSGDGVTLLNFSLDPPATVQTYVDAIRKVAGVGRLTLTVPRFPLLAASYPIDWLASAFGIEQPISPVRVRKLFRSTNIDPRRLRELGYKWKFSIEDAFRDWMSETPGVFLKRGEKKEAGPVKELMAGMRQQESKKT